MVNKADLLARLQDGDSVDDIAKEMADALNEAKNMYDEEQDRWAKEEAKEKEEADRVKEAKREAVKVMLDGLCDFCTAANDDAMLEAVHNVDVDEIVDLIDGVRELHESLEGLRCVEFPKHGLFNLFR